MARDVMTPGLSLPLGQRSEGPARMFAPPGGALDEPSSQIVIRSIAFASDHQKLTDHTSDWETGGRRYAKPEWSFYKRDETAKPVSHTMAEPIELELTVAYNTWDEAPPKPVKIVGTARLKVDHLKTKTLEFKSDSVVLKPGSTKVTVKSKHGFPAKVQKLDLTIEWEIIGKGLKRDPADESTPIFAPNIKSKHEVLVTMGEPEAVDPQDKGKEDKAFTYKRMAYAVGVIEALNVTEPHPIVEKLLKGFPGFELGQRFANAWNVADNKSVDCRSIVQYITDVIKMVGCPGKAEVVLVFPRLKNKAWPGKKINVGHGEFLPGFQLEKEPTSSDFEAVAEAPPTTGNFGGLDRPALIHPNGKYKAILFSSGDGQNVFEGCLRFTHGKTRYYAGGSGVFASKEQVLRDTFESFSWGYFDTGDPTTEEDDQMRPVKGKAIMPPWIPG